MSHIVHMTSVHARHDTRIALRECSAVLRSGHSCVLIVADGKGEETKDGLRVLDVGAPASRLQRMTRTVRHVEALARSLNADLYHFHDPELIPAGLRLKAAGKHVIYDMHEDVTMDILSKHWIPEWLRAGVSSSFGHLERRAVKKLSATVTAWPYLREKFESLNPNVVDIVNYAKRDEMRIERAWIDRPREICYLGGISHIRGVYEVLRALDGCEARLNLAGDFHETSTEKRARAMPEWESVNYHGFVSRKAAAELMGRSRIGLVTFLPEPNHVNAMPNKLFEYMSAGLPVIASDFPRWRAIVDTYRCGICVDPRDVAAISTAIRRLLDDPLEAETMGANGRRAVLEKFNWDSEASRLVELYGRLLGETGSSTATSNTSCTSAGA